MAENKIKHSALTKKIRRDFYAGQKEILNILEHCDVQPFVGCLPAEWRQNLSREELAEKTREADAALGEFAVAVYGDRYGRTVNREDRDSLKVLSEKLRGILRLPIKCRYLSQGCTGKAFVISLPEKDFILKVDHRNSLADHRSEHGVSGEMASGIFIGNYGDKKYFVKSFLGRLAEDDTAGAYVIKEYQKRGAPKVAGPDLLDRIVRRVKWKNPKEAVGNVAGGKGFDLGGLTVEEELRDRPLSIIVRQLVNVLKTNDPAQVMKIYKKYAAHSFTQELAQRAVGYIDAAMKREFPDLDENGIHRYNLPYRAMAALGVSNRPPVDGFLMMVLDVEEILKVRRPEEITEEIRRRPRDMYVTEAKAEILMVYGARAEDFAGTALDLKYLREREELINLDRQKSNLSDRQIIQNIRNRWLEKPVSRYQVMRAQLSRKNKCQL